MQLSETLAATHGERPLVAELLRFIKASKRGVMRSVRGLSADDDR